jgi:hypothetical protein
MRPGSCYLGGSSSRRGRRDQSFERVRKAPKVLRRLVRVERQAPDQILVVVGDPFDRDSLLLQAQQQLFLPAVYLGQVRALRLDEDLIVAEALALRFAEDEQEVRLERPAGVEIVDGKLALVAKHDHKS